MCEWGTQNKMDINVSKCDSISFSRKPLEQQLSSEYCIGSEKLQKVEKIRDLGVMLDSKMSFTHQIDHVVAKARIVLGFIKRQSKEFKCAYVTKSLYCSLVRSILEYCSVIWSPWTGCGRDKVESVQKQFLLFALRNLQWSHPFMLPPYESRLNLLNMQTLEKRRIKACCMVIFDLLQGHIKVHELCEMLERRYTGVNTRLAQRLQLTIPILTTNYEKNAPIPRCCNFFNKFAQNYSPAFSREQFKSKIMKAI